MTQLDEIDRQIKALEKRRACLKDADNKLKKLDEFDDAEKAVHFDELHKYCLDAVVELTSTGYWPKDFWNYLGEYVMERCLGEEVWEVLSEVVD